MEDPEYINIQEAANQLRVGVETVRQHIRSGIFKVAKVGPSSYTDARGGQEGGIDRP